MVDNSENYSSKPNYSSQLEEMEEALQNLRFQKSMQQLEDLSQIKKMKKKIARYKTIMSQENKLNGSDN